MFKTILLVDLNLGTPTDIASDGAQCGRRPGHTGAAGALDPSMTPLFYSTQLSKFNLPIDPGGTAQVMKTCSPTI